MIDIFNEYPWSVSEFSAFMGEPQKSGRFIEIRGQVRTCPMTS